MAAPTYNDVLTQINTYIVSNGNNEITGPVLNGVLEILLNFVNNNIGDLSTLTTDQKNSIVEAINSLKGNFDDLVNNGVQLYQGLDDPNDTPPPTYKYADFYMQLDSDSDPVKLWQWNGTEWTDQSQDPQIQSDNVINNSSVPGITLTLALDYLLTNLTTLPPKKQFTADGIQDTFNLSTTALAKMVFWNGVPLNGVDWTQTGTNITLTFVPDNGALIQMI